MKNLLVIDGNSILNRAFYGIKPLTNSKGQPTNALYGFLNILLKHLGDLNPDYAAIAFDVHAPTFRHKEYAEYKAGRKGMPDELRVQFPYSKEIAKALGIHVLELEGYEADDIPEYLGLSYASLGMTMESISAFTEALLVRESDSLLLSIAEQYYKAEEYGAAIQYLFRIIQNSKNDELKIKSLNLLGNIYIKQEKYDEAMKEFEKVLEINENSADAHYGIGVIYEIEGNIVKARSEWRKTLKIHVNHAGALQKMSEN